jgi:ribosomal protein S24E
LQAEKKLESKVLDRTYVEVSLKGRGGKVTRKDAIESVAKELGVAPDNVVGRFYVYGSAESKKRLHPRHLEVRLLTKEEREKIKQEKKKPATAAAPAEAKK